ncbi:MAG: methylglyoxal synthase [Clostridiaceae bacterium]|nr:methylglyoxal synthase [Clostridiaceae bacterium]
MNIVLIADTRKYDLLVNFCIAYNQILEKHRLISLFNISRSIRENTDLTVETLATDISAGIEQLASKATYNEIDAVIYLRDTLLGTYDQPNSLLKSCDANSIPYATNVASAELLVLAIDRGDLDWRELLR